MADERIELPQGTLDLLILKVLSLEPQHGWAISERLQQISTGVVECSRDRSTRRCIASSGEAGSGPSGRRPITTATRNTRNSPVRTADI